MRILYITDALAIWGGMERILINKVNLLADLYSYDMHLITVNQGNHPIPYPLNPMVNYEDLMIQLHKQYQYSGIKRLVKWIQLNRLYNNRIRQKIQEIHPDVVVCTRLLLVGAIVKAKGSIPLVYESHTYRKAPDILGTNLYTRLKSIFTRRNEKVPEVVVALTEGDANNWKKVNPHVCVIPNVVNLNDTGQYSDCLSKSVIFVGRFSAQKDIQSLLAIWELVHRTHPDWQLQIYGGYGEQQVALLPVIKQMGASIVVKEPTADIMNRYMENSILVMTSAYEPFGLVLPEAMSCGLPVVAFDCPYGPANIITDGVDGFLIKNRDIHEFADKLCLLMEDLTLRKKMGQAGVISSHRYEPSRIMPQWKQLFKDLT